MPAYITIERDNHHFKVQSPPYLYLGFIFELAGVKSPIN